MRFTNINRRRIAQRARRNAERERAVPRAGPPSIPHGTQIGRIVIEYHGQRVAATILQAGDRCRSHGVIIDGGPVALMGLYAATRAVQAKLARVPARRSDFWEWK